MAGSTIEMKRAAWWQVGLSVAAVVLVGMTARYAYRAAVAAEKINNITQDSTERQLRAYVSISDGRIQALGHNFPIVAMMDIKNFGQTPAYGVTITFQMQFDHFPTPDEKFVLSPTREGASRSIVGPGGSMRFPITGNRLTQDDLSDLKSGKMALYVHGRISYKDVFGQCQSTKFRYMTGGDAGAGTALSPCNRGNEAT